MIVSIPSAKLSIVFPQGSLPSIDPEDPIFTMIRQAAKNSGLLPRNLRVSSRLSSRCIFTLDLGGVRIVSKFNAKAARKLASHGGGAVLQGKLISGMPLPLNLLRLASRGLSLR